ncbi:extradiol ring-cleavage dioxygenase [Geodermatophilus sp. Leaf369]|jgi:4,5-DOPA dioxygenase extradiol|uniref:dioxygenase family protein n=1 Tax=Geodermatophilus sp. Leaf369 TaxID=1736354 RepID=UPI0006FEA080|nr:class III extradiol ring-cleavage dioxygenase [Geodermatophilus sp. Leaf369]KQS58376.1 extradiol ring-cleavage dioxygenase [Geodermatophilus sp. Leaf369]
MASIFDPQVPAGAFDDFLVDALPAAREQRSWTAEDGALPSLYLSHGAPPLFDDGPWMRDLHTWALSMPKPKDVLIVSAHWESAPLSLSGSAAHTPLVYDFGGFARRYYEMTYETPDASDLARRVAAAMPDSEPVHEHSNRGLDHGAWVPLKVMYPLGDVPVLQMSLPTHDPERLMDLGRRVRELREEGTLVIGSGFMTHGLPFLTRESVTSGQVPSWSADFDAWAADALDRGDVDALADYAHRAPGLPYAHPTVEHFTPLFVTLGAADQPERPVTTTIDGWMMGLSRRSFQLQ